MLGHRSQLPDTFEIVRTVKLFVAKLVNSSKGSTGYSEIPLDDPEVPLDYPEVPLVGKFSHSFVSICVEQIYRKFCARKWSLLWPYFDHDLGRIEI